MRPDVIIAFLERFQACGYIRPSLTVKLEGDQLTLRFEAEAGGLRHTFSRHVTLLEIRSSLMDVVARELDTIAREIARQVPNAPGAQWR